LVAFPRFCFASPIDSQAKKCFLQNYVDKWVLLIIDQSVSLSGEGTAWILSMPESFAKFFHACLISSNCNAMLQYEVLLTTLKLCAGD
jgi:hypothetical protein